jgi:hypothetical protein
MMMVPVFPSIYSSSMVYTVVWHTWHIWLLMTEYEWGWSLDFPLYSLPPWYTLCSTAYVTYLTTYDKIWWGWSLDFPLYIHHPWYTLCSTAYRDIKKPTGHASHTNHPFGALGSFSIKDVSSAVLFSNMSKRWAFLVKYSPLISFRNWHVHCT